MNTFLFSKINVEIFNIYFYCFITKVLYLVWGNAKQKKKVYLKEKCCLVMFIMKTGGLSLLIRCIT